jgi:hypothetical protein
MTCGRLGLSVKAFTHSDEGNDLLSGANRPNLHGETSIAGAIARAVALVAEADRSSAQSPKGS